MRNGVPSGSSGIATGSPVSADFCKVVQEYSGRKVVSIHRKNRPVHSCRTRSSFGLQAPMLQMNPNPVSVIPLVIHTVTLDWTGDIKKNMSLRSSWESFCSQTHKARLRAERPNSPAFAPRSNNCHTPPVS